MTTIKLRRGLSTAFSTNNPVLAAGEPAFATDTRILKIGDGTTAYNNLPSIGASPDLSNYVQKTDYASTSAAGVIKVDGSTITIDADGVISAAGSSPSNMVTTDTNQTITGYKRFNEGITIVQDGLLPPAIIMSDGTTSATVLSLQYGNTNLLTLTGAPDINITAEGKLAFAGNPTNVVRSRAGVEYEMLDVSMVDGTTITYDSTTGKISAAGGGGGASIDDNNTSSTTTFSSQKIVNTITQASTDLLDEVADEFVASTDIRNIVKLTQAAYDALATKDANTFYIIVAASS